LSWQSASLACSGRVDAIFGTIPANGNEGQPTNLAPLIIGDVDSIELLDGDGNLVPMSYERVGQTDPRAFPDAHLSEDFWEGGALDSLPVF
jgi:hypothetical protein